MSIIDPVTFTLSTAGNSVGTAEYIAVSQSMYAQARVPDVGDGNIATFGIAGSEGYDFNMVFTNEGGTLYWYIGPDRLSAEASGTYVAGDLFNIYADKQTVIFKKSGVDVYRVPEPRTALSYRMLFVFAVVVTPVTITFTNVLFYPSGARGSAGTPYTLAVETGDADILTSSSFELVSAGDVVHTLEAFPISQGLYMQARIPVFVEGTVTIGLATPEEIGQNRFVRVTFTSDKTFLMKIEQFEGDVVYGEYLPGDLISIFLDDTTLIVYKNREVIRRVLTQGTGVERKSYKFYAYSSTTAGRAIFNDVALYQTGERGQDGTGFTTLVPLNEYAFVTSPTSFRFRSRDPFSDVLPTQTVEPAIHSAESIDCINGGLFLQFKPFAVEIGSMDAHNAGIGDPSTATGYYFQFSEDGTTPVYVINGIVGTLAPYTPGTVFAIYTDGTTVTFSVAGQPVLQRPLVSGTYKFAASGEFVTHTNRLYDTTDFKFYPTGKIGPPGPSFTTLTALNNSTVLTTSQCTLNVQPGSISDVYTPEYFDTTSQGLVIQMTAPGITDATGKLVIGFKRDTGQLGMYVVLSEPNLYTVYNNSSENTVLASNSYTPGSIFRVYMDGNYAYTAFGSGSPVAFDPVQQPPSTSVSLYISSSDDFTTAGTYYFNNVRFYPTGRAVYAGSGIYDFTSVMVANTDKQISVGATQDIATIEFPSSMVVRPSDNCLVTAAIETTIEYPGGNTFGYIEFTLTYTAETPATTYTVYFPMLVENNTTSGRTVSNLRFTMPPLLLNVGGGRGTNIVLSAKNKTDSVILLKDHVPTSAMIQIMNTSGVGTL
jgi:hypothetical protein